MAKLPPQAPSRLPVHAELPLGVHDPGGWAEPGWGRVTRRQGAREGNGGGHCRCLESNLGRFGVNFLGELLVLFSGSRFDGSSLTQW